MVDIVALRASHQDMSMIARSIAVSSKALYVVPVPSLTKDLLSFSLHPNTSGIYLSQSLYLEGNPYCSCIEADNGTMETLSHSISHPNKGRSTRLTLLSLSTDVMPPAEFSSSFSLAWRSSQSLLRCDSPKTLFWLHQLCKYPCGTNGRQQN